MRTLKAGTEIKCEGCDTLIAVTSREIHTGQQISESMFAADKGQGPWKYGELMCCRKCQTGWRDTVHKVFNKLAIDVQRPTV